jgi:hypothetical protein
LAIRALLVLAILSTAAGCGAVAQTGSPRSTLDAMRAATTRHDWAALYGLLPAAARREESLDAFRARMSRDRQDVGELADEIGRGYDEQREPVVEVPSRQGGAVPIVDEADGWRLAQPGFGPAPAPSAAEAARMLRAALVRRSLPALLSVLSARARGALEAEMSALIDALADPEALDITSTSAAGQRLEVHLPDGRSLVMVREAQGWRVDDVR